MRKDLKDVDAGVAGVHQRPHVVGADQVPEPGADAEASQCLEFLVGQFPGDR
jgi:hypothetical protein